MGLFGGPGQRNDMELDRRTTRHVCYATPMAGSFAMQPRARFGLVAQNTPALLFRGLQQYNLP